MTAPAMTRFGLEHLRFMAQSRFAPSAAPGRARRTDVRRVQDMIGHRANVLSRRRAG